ncbi:biliverdin-producing heme oxygenase [Swaminathania salitolerans]|uniref:biliverdin-producing heme oxygenase n=1 Tax=Swaminathania salitolerans TaxID=182838 RepID=UPI0011BFD8C8|nr:biliverdin-producing heme oxygenase [Swaminathania salitolerans]
MTPRRNALRLRMRDTHEQLDDALGAFASVSDYYRYLRAIAGFRLAAEQPLHGYAYPSWFGAWRPALISPLLEVDLAHLALAPPVMEPLAPPQTISALLGWIYTLEGAALGARLIARRAHALGFGEMTGAGHLAGQIGHPERWAVFLDVLEAAPVFEIGEAEQAARVVFGHAHRAVQRVDGREGRQNG